MGVCMVCGSKDINEDDTPTFCSYECANVYDSEASIAQLAERSPHKGLRAGSSPAGFKCMARAIRVQSISSGSLHLRGEQGPIPRFAGWNQTVACRNQSALCQKLNLIESFNP